MTQYTSTHWGVRVAVHNSDGTIGLAPLKDDPDPNIIGLDQLDDSMQSLRVRRPAIRKSWLDDGPGAHPERRGREPFVEVSWDTALDLAATEIDRVRSDYGNSAIFGGSYGWSSAGRFHHAQSQVHRFLNSVGGYVSHADSYSLGAARVVMPHVIAPMPTLMANHTSWDVMRDHTRLLVCFGGIPLKNSQISAGGITRHRTKTGVGAMAQADVRIVNIGPVGDNLDGNAVEWLQCRPNTDTAVLLSMAYVLHVEGLADTAFLNSHCTGFERFVPYLTGKADGIAKSPEWAESISGLDADIISSLARDMAATRTMLNMSWSLQRASHGEQPSWMLVVLAAMLGQIGLPGGGFGFGYGATNALGSDDALLPGPTLPQGTNAVQDFIPVSRIADLLLNPGAPFTYNGKTHRYADIKLIYWAGGNPWHHHQDLNRLARAWQKPETIIINEQYWTPAAKRADIVFPATLSAEREDIGHSSREGHLVAMAQITPPLDDARDDYDIFTELSERLGSRDVFTEGLDSSGWLRRLYEDARGVLQRRKVVVPDYDSFREVGLIDLASESAPVVMYADFRENPMASPLPTPSGKIEIFSDVIAAFDIADCPPHPVWREPAEWLGQCDITDGRLHLLSDQPGRKLHSQLDASAHSRDGKVNGRERVHLNPEDALARGIAQDDVVELFNGRGICLASAHLNPKIMRGVARLATGAWYDPDDAGRDRAGNPNVLTLDIGSSGLSQGCVAQTCLVEVRGPVNEPPCTTAFDLPQFTLV